MKEAAGVHLLVVFRVRSRRSTNLAPVKSCSLMNPKTRFEKYAEEKRATVVRRH